MADHSGIKKIRDYLNTEENPVSIREFLEFWESLTEEEREAFKAEELPEK